MELTNINAFLNELEELKKAHALLTQIWSEIGPYGGEMEYETSYKLQEHFNFDDSE